MYVYIYTVCLYMYVVDCMRFIRYMPVPCVIPNVVRPTYTAHASDFQQGLPLEPALS